MLNADIIKSYFSSDIASVFSPIEIFQSIDSTNSYLLNLPASEKQSGYVCLAEQQSAGRGRLERVWDSPNAENIYMSILWKVPIEKRAGLSLMIAMAIVELLQEIELKNIKVKWPNDVLVNGKKIAGILVEATGEYVVIGIGINVNMLSNENLNQAWTSIAYEKGTLLDRNKLLAQLLKHLCMGLSEFERIGLDKVFTLWPTVDALKDKTIVIQQGEQNHEGVALGINAAGALLLSKPSGIQPFYSGEVSKIHLPYPLG